MKKILFGILTFLGIGLSFCSAETYFGGTMTCYVGTPVAGYNECSDDSLFLSEDGNSFITTGTYRLSVSTTNGLNFWAVAQLYPIHNNINSYFLINSAFGTYYDWIFTCDDDYYCNLFNFYSFSSPDYGNGLITISVVPYSQGGSSTSDIDVYYNNGNSVESITCDGTQAIDIRGLSTITSTNTFTPYYNISYTDEDNQKLTESYSKDILYLENGQFKKTFTGENDWILTYQGSSDNTFTGYVPVFDFTGDTIVNTGNVFNNFSDNALKVLLSNIPSYIQYITIFAILVFLFSFIRRFKRKS